MSVVSLSNRNSYTGDGATSNYAFTFKVQSADHLRVFVVVNDVIVVLENEVDYTINGVGDSDGSIDLIADSQEWMDGNFLENGIEIVLRRKLPLKQTTSIRNQGSYNSAVIEDSLDRIVMEIQQLQHEIDRCIKIPENVSTDDFDTELAEDIVGQSSRLIGTNADGSGVTLGTSEDFENGVETGGPFTITNGMAATAVTGMTLDASAYSSAEYLVEIIRGSTIFLLQRIYLVYLNGAWVIHEGAKVGSGDDHGLTWSVAEAAGVATVKIASDSSGTGTLTFKRVAFS